jgi:integrase
MEYAKARRYLSKESSELDAVPVAKDDGGEIEIFTPDEIAKLLALAKPHQLPFLAIGAFSGIRHAEITRLKWGDIGTDFITVSAGNAKTSSRRLVPVSQNLNAWLANYRKQSGLVSSYSNMSEEMLWLAKKAGVTWGHNGLRHSFISCRVAEIQNVAHE